MPVTNNQTAFANDHPKTIRARIKVSRATKRPRLKAPAAVMPADSAEKKITSLRITLIHDASKLGGWCWRMASSLAPTVHRKANISIDISGPGATRRIRGGMCFVKLKNMLRAVIDNECRRVPSAPLSVYYAQETLHNKHIAALTSRPISMAPRAICRFIIGQSFSRRLARSRPCSLLVSNNQALRPRTPGTKRGVERRRDGDQPPHCIGPRRC